MSPALDADHKVASRPRPDIARVRTNDRSSGVASDEPAAPTIGNYLAADVQRWLDWQCRMISGVLRGGVFLVSSRDPGQLDAISFWPEDGGRTSVLRTVAAKAIQGRSGVVQKALDDTPAQDGVCDYLAFPLIHAEAVIGAVTMALEIRSEAQRQAVMQLVQWGTTWLESLLANGLSKSREASSMTLEAIALLAAERPLAVGGHDVCTHLAEHLDCSRVVLGLNAGMHIQVAAMSHQVGFDRRVSKVGRLEAAMEECIDQDQLIMLPSDDPENHCLTRAHDHLLRDDGVGSICSIPLRAGDDPVGVLTLIRDRGEAFDQRAVAALSLAAERLGPVLALKRRESASIGRRLVAASRDWLAGLLGAGHLRLKLITALLVIGLAVLMLVQTDYRVSAQSTIEGASQQAVVAPFEGYVAAAHARAGDRVEQGQVLAILDDRDLLLEQEKWTIERQKHGKEYQEALATRDRAKASVGVARIAQAEAQLRLIEEQLDRTKLRAPFPGLLASGDLSRSLGAPVERGQLLFELVPEGGFRVDLMVDEHDISALEAGQTGTLRLNGFPDRSIAIRVARIIPVASAVDGGNRFRVEAELDESPDGLRPGMQGVAKVTVGRGSLLWVWTRELIGRLRLLAWSFGF